MSAIATHHERRTDALYTRVASPLGELLLFGDESALSGVWIASQRRTAQPAAGRRSATDPFARAADQFGEYFAGERVAFDLPLRLEGTAFCMSVWEALLETPFAETRSYGETAASIGRPRAARAVGLANGRNPLAIVVPCHRVIGAGGQLVGYGGGLDRKLWLLRHEARVARPSVAARMGPGSGRRRRGPSGCRDRVPRPAEAFDAFAVGASGTAVAAVRVDGQTADGYL